jgi:2',3'-cyclic-nucleotide 2'-phosphodiesterase
MNLLFIGDVFGRPGRETVKKLLKKYRQKHEVDFVVANAENMHHGKGVTEKNIADMRDAGVDFFTSGNHVFKDRTILPHLDDKKLPLIRPDNYPPGVPGRGWEIVSVGKRRVLVINLMGRVFMPMHLDCPFRAADRILEETKDEKLSAILVDFHAETTSEKMALAHYLDGRVTAVMGTHTHVPTADARILKGGTAFQTDTGLTGPIDSVIGVEKGPVIENFLTQMPVKHEVAAGPTVFNAILIGVDEKSRKATHVLPLQQYLE